MHYLLKLFAMLFLLGNTAEALATVSVTERNALIAIYNKTEGPKWKVNTNWLAAAGTECTWFGVQCNVDQTTVIGLDLGFNFLYGQIPVELAQLTNLTSLRLVGNALYGAIPVELGQLALLQNLYLYSNLLSGAIPAELGNLTQLLNLDLSNNFLSSVPSSIGNLSLLQNLDLYTNKLTTLPNEIGNLSQLRNLDVSENAITLLPDQISGLTLLQSLNLSKNNLTALPSGINGLTALQTLNLNNNQLASLSDQVGLLDNLISLSVANNQLTSIPEGLAPFRGTAVSSLQSLDFSFNQITTVPSTLGALGNLLDLKLNNNQLTAVPAGLENILNLSLDISDNPILKQDVISGLVSYFRLKGLALRGFGLSDADLGAIANFEGFGFVKLDLSNNQFTGSFINPLFLSALTDFNLSNNALTQLTGLHRLTTLVNLDLSNNPLTTLPTIEWSTLPALQNLNLTNTQLNSVPSELINLSALVNLNVSYNQLTALPTQFGSFTHLQTLTLTANQLTTLPAELGGLTSLINLEAGNNALSSVPVTFSNLLNLQYLNLSNNQLTSLPDALGGLVKLNRLVLTNNLLTALPASLGNLADFSVLEIGGNNLTSLPTAFANLNNLHLNIGNTPIDRNSLSNFPLLRSLQLTGPASISTDYAWLSQLTQLQFLSINNAQLTTIPPAVLQLPNLTSLNLAHNQISGIIPEQLAQRYQLETLDLSFNQLIGNIPSLFGNLTHLNALDLSGNQLNGTLPTELGAPRKINALRLANNQFSGVIPVSLQQLVKTTQITLENNSCLTTNDLNLMVFLGQKDPSWQTQFCNGLIAEFIANPIQGDRPLLVNLDASSSTISQGSIDEYSWVSSDGQTATGRTAAFTLNTAGNINIALTVRNFASSKTSTTSKTLKVFELPPPVVTSITPISATLNQPTTFTINGSNLTAGMGFDLAGCTPTDQEVGTGSATQRSFACTPTVVGNAAGTVKTTPTGTTLFNFTVSVFDVTVPVSSPLVTSVTPLTATLNQSTIFTITGTNLTAGMGFELPGCTPANLEVGSGSANQRSFACTPTQTGNLTGAVKTSASSITIYTVNINVAPENFPEVVPPVLAPDAAFNVTSSAAEAPATVTVTATPSNDSASNIISYLWQFSDGRKVNGAQASLSFENAGAYSVSLTVTNSAGLTATSTKTFSLKAKPPLGFQISLPADGKTQAPLTLTLDASGLNIDDPNTTYSWQATLQSVKQAKTLIRPKANTYIATGILTSMTLTEPGVYSINLTAVDSQGKVYNQTQSIEVLSSPDATTTTEQIAPVLPAGSFVEPNDTPDQATPILVNDAPLIHLLYASNVDWYVFYAQKDLNYTIEIPLESLGREIHPTLQIFDNAYQPLTNQITQTVTNVGIRVSGKAPYTGFFHIQVTNAPPFGRAVATQDYSYRLRVFLTDAPQQGLIKGKVLDACKQNGINQAEVAAIVGGTTTDSTLTFKTGEFGLLLNPNTYKIQSSASNFFSYGQTTLVDQTTDANIDFYLAPVSNCNALGETAEQSLIRQEQDAVAVYDVASGVLIVRDVTVGGEVFYAELQNIGNFQFQIIRALSLPGTIHAIPARYQPETLLATLPKVFALNKTWKVELKYHDGLFELEHYE